jgi:DNA-directed RNA polymerase specialized sigma24 family protein
LLSAQTQAAGSEEALAELCKLYWYPLYGYVRRRGYSTEDAQDLTQGFFLDFLDRRNLSTQQGHHPGLFTFPNMGNQITHKTNE